MSSCPRRRSATGPTTADVDVRAVKGGTTGNVDAGTITVVPAALAQSGRVSHQSGPATSGGKHVEDTGGQPGRLRRGARIAERHSSEPTLGRRPWPTRNSVPRGLVAFAAERHSSAPAQPDQAATTVVGVGRAKLHHRRWTRQRTSQPSNESQIEQVAAAASDGRAAERPAARRQRRQRHARCGHGCRRCGRLQRPGRRPGLQEPGPAIRDRGNSRQVARSMRVPPWPLLGTADIVDLAGLRRPSARSDRAHQRHHRRAHRQLLRRHPRSPRVRARARLLNLRAARGPANRATAQRRAAAT